MYIFESVTISDVFYKIYVAKSFLYIARLDVARKPISQQVSQGLP